MNKESIYAVVDIETTGTSLEQDKIIQIGCVLVQNGEKINEFSTDLNPMKNIPKSIEALTGITNAQVAMAPYFEDIVFFLKQQLEDCVFVAHNAYFDLSFLNSEFQRCGESPLAVECLDTVELAHVLFPMSAGHRVSDLAEYLDISHDQPHQALSDATVTADILIKLIEKLISLPDITRSSLANLSKSLGMNNHDFFKMFSENKRIGKRDYDVSYHIISDIALKKQSYRFMEHREECPLTFPKTNTEKIQLFEPEFSLRKPQVQMMDLIDKFLDESKTKNMIIQAGTGIGKSIGYLFPILLHEKGPLVVSTSTLVLQDQLLQQELPKLSQMTNYDWQGVVLKSSRHFIDLSRFSSIMHEKTEQKQYALYQMACLVWLLETDTGDLSELTLNQNHAFYEDIYHRGLPTLNKKDLFYDVDFLRYRYRQLEFADVILVNHAFLVSQSDHQIFKKAATLVIDEAHQLLPTIERQGIDKVAFKEIYILINQMSEFFQDEDKWRTEPNHLLDETLSLHQLMLTEIKESCQVIERYLIKSYRLNKPFIENELFEQSAVNSWPVDIRRELKQLLRMIKEFSFVTEEVKQLLLDHYGRSWFVQEYFNAIERLSELFELTDRYFKLGDETLVRWLKQISSHLVLAAFDYQSFSIENTAWYQSFKKVIFTGGTLQIDTDSTYYETQLNLTQVAKYKTDDLYDYTTQTEFLVYDQEIDFGNIPEFSRLISQMVDKLCSTENLKRMLLLFTSHQVLKEVYHLLLPVCQKLGIDLLAQNITGSNEKIVKRFAKGNRVIILGADSFWEGIDLSSQSLDAIIITKLPFDPPNRPLVKIRNAYLTAQGENPFYADALPKAGLRLRQGLGRLLRRESDRGVMIVLDNRLVSSSYHKLLESYLPEQLTIKVVNQFGMLRLTEEFFNKTS
ncbi:helicase C-terminal domain-containing protein [Vagococcus vulneris]|uniref:3'-5' exonuclease DinG n=1 Tax=Vagococcus vulneris TaxID=1977869 RepID=A0A429ZWX7_9ENTE|nr:helicase C-terminal domain-containing protein [Vagococcus vulneris]RST98316.1 hypothetical protein CBF37_08380 [Vagococcus vulneris]